jgi:hypothetical protein
MKHIYLFGSYFFVAVVIVLSLFGNAHAEQQSNSAAGSQSGAVIVQDFGHNAASPAVDLSRAVGTAYAPAIPGSLITCQGGVSVGAGFAGGAFSLGRSIESDPCNLRQNAQLLANLGDMEAARIVMCTDPIIRAAYLLTDRPCPQSNPTINAAKIKAKSLERLAALQAQYDKRYGIK